MSETKPSEGSPPSSASKETGFLEGDDSWTQWRNFFTMLLGKMPAEGQKRYWQERDKRNEVADCARCDEQKKYLLQYSACAFSIVWRGLNLSGRIGPVIRYLRKNINQLGGDINETNVHCRRCEEAQGGGFSPEFGIKVCANQMTSKGMLEDTIAHEMVHAYDHLRFKLDWHDDLRHAACTEVGIYASSTLCRLG